MKGLPHDFYMTDYIKDISKWRNNNSKGEYNKSAIEYILKLQYFNKILLAAELSIVDT